MRRVPPGWYPEGEGGSLRWWDGEQWTAWHQPRSVPGTWPPPDPRSVAGPTTNPTDPTHHSQGTGRTHLWIIGVVAAVAIVLTGGALAAYNLGHQAASLAHRVPVASEGGSPITGAAGYTTVGGPDGNPLAQGRPWGSPCTPIVFVVAPSVPPTLSSEIMQTVAEARGQGVDMEVENQEGYWYPAELYPSGLTNADVRFVDVFANAGTPPLLTNGHAEHINFGWNARPLGNAEALTDLQATIYLRSVGNDRLTIRRSIRQMIAFAAGVGASTAPHTGISNRTSTDTLTTTDLRAIRLMSGCRPPHA